MEDKGKDSQFSYPSNLVIQRERENVARSDEPTGEPESLAGRIDPRMMGTLGQREKPQGSKNITVKEQKFDPHRRTRIHGSGGNVMTAEIDENLLYRPKTKETRIVYEKVLALINAQMPDQSQDVIKSVVDEILAVLKNEDTRDFDKKQEIEGLISKISNEFFSDLLLNSKQLTDYNPEVEEQFERYEEELRVPVVFDEDENQDDQSEEDEQIIDEESQEVIEEVNEKAINFMDVENDDQDISQILQPWEIDAYWLHGQLSQFFNDPIKAQDAVDDVLELLNAPTDINCENGLVQMFGQQNFDLIKLLHENRHTIYFMTRMMRAKSDEESILLKEEMMASEAGQQVLEALSKRSKQKERAKKQSEEKKEQSQIDQLQEVINMPDKEFQAIPKKILDIENMVFLQEGHTMSNDKCHLPPGSYKVSKKGYEEIYIPAVKQKALKDKLVRVEDLPRFAQPAFGGFKELNVIQSQVSDSCLNSNQNLLICAPTGAGKTNVALLTMLEVIGRYINHETLQADLSLFKIVYIAPMKALVSEQVMNFQKRLEPYGIKVGELTGDSTLTKHQISETQVLIATPEKWDILTRKVLSNTFISLVRLIIIDEIHLLHDSRGPVLEAIVARTIRSVEELQQQIRLVGLSATLPNYVDVASFLRVNQSGVYYFDNSFRPVPLQQQYIGITEKKPIRRILLMNEILYEKVSERAGKSQVLVFVHSRKDTVKTAKLLKESAFAKDELNKFLKEESVSRKVLEEVLQREDIKSPELRELLEYGFAIHHAGLSRTDRDLVEQLFGDKHIQVLVSTATLAWGVNLPAHTVIIKGTQVYSPERSRWIELSPQDILQMMGRAGRPRFDTKGEGIIITTYQELKFYLSLLNMQLPIESQFISGLSDQLNAEIALGSVQTLKQSVNWLGYTYLYVRMLRNPSLYQIDQSEIQNDPLLVSRRCDLAHSAVSILDKHGLIKYDRKTGLLESTILGRIASYYYLKYPSVAVYNQHLKPNMGMIELFKVFSLSQEFKQLSIREEEKLELQRLMMSVPVPIKGSPDDPTTKVNVLVQAYISRLKLEGLALNSDMVYITQSAGRLMRALYEICVKREWAQAALTALNMAKMVEKRMWNCMTPLRQFKGLPEEILKRVEKKEGVTWENLYQMSAQQIGELIRYPNLGKTVHKLIHKFPRIEIHAFAQPITRSCLRIDLQLTPDFQWDEKMHGKQEPFHIFVLDCDCERILYAESFLLKYKTVVQGETKSNDFSFTVPLFEIMHPIYFIRVVSDRWIACEAEQAIPFKNLLLPEHFSQVTELIGRSPLPLSSLEFPQIERVLSKKILSPGTTHLDAIQTQVFNSIYCTLENVFVGSPSFKSKMILPYLAALQSVQVFPQEKVVYVSPDQRICEQRFKDFVQLFSKSGVLNLKVAQLTGQIALDSKLLETSNIIVSTAQNWDIISRRWRQRRGFQAIRLFIADDLHRIPETYSTLEVVVSRMRKISALGERPIRIVGLALSIADYREIAEWIGSQPMHTFNFSPLTRGTTLQVLIQGFDQSHRPTRINAMLKSVYPSLKGLSVIYVSDRKQARLCALDLMAFAKADNISYLSKDIDSKRAQEIQQSISGDTYLSYTVGSGIGFLYECMDANDESVLVELVNNGLINVVIMTYGLALKYGLQANTVVVLEGTKYDGVERRYVDYSIPEVLEMLESSVDIENAKFILLVHTPKKEFYKKFLSEPLPVESHLNHYLGVHLNAEVVSKNLLTKQDCIDWMTWTFLYRRITQNPNYYNLSEVSGQHINNYLSELIENTIEELEDAKCIAVEDDNELDAINSGIIANYYYVGIQTVATFTEQIKDNSKLKDLLLCLTKAQEFETVQIRNSEEVILQKLSRSVNYQPEQQKLNEPNTKAYILLQAYFSRININSDLKFDQNQLLETAVRLCCAMVDVSSSNLWLRPSILCMQLCQMLVQALWVNSDSQLKQIPHIDNQTIDQLQKMKIEDLADFMNMEDEDRTSVLSKYSQSQVDAIATACNRYPSIEIKEISAQDVVTSGQTVQVKVILERQGDDYTDFVIAPHYSKSKEEQWWILCADKKNNKLHGIKKITLKDIARVDLRFQAPEPGKYQMTIYAICDSYIGADQISTFEIVVTQADEEQMDEEEAQE